MSKEKKLIKSSIIYDIVYLVYQFNENEIFMRSKIVFKEIAIDLSKKLYFSKFVIIYDDRLKNVSLPLNYWIQNY